MKSLKKRIKDSERTLKRLNRNKAESAEVKFNNELKVYDALLDEAKRRIARDVSKKYGLKINDLMFVDVC